jgi:endo-beta-N-acetylglucosaminidase D
VKVVRMVGVVVVAAALAGASLLPGSSSRDAGAAVAGPGQPYAPNWHPADLLTWSPATDPDAPFNKSVTPLVPRVQDALTAANPDASARRLLALSVFANTDGNPSQGSANFDYYTSEFWQYIDTLVFWGGSASEGLILAPNPTVTDAAHRNGVPVYGTVFFPPVVYGGQLQWVQDLLQRDAAGHFPLARKLAEVSHYYGFEGWFINQETDGTDAASAADLRDFIAELKAYGSRVIWYDAMNETGAVGWRGALDSLNDSFFAASDLMFVDFRWDLPDLPASADYARSMGRSPAELYFGVDTGWRQFRVQPDFDAIFPAAGASGASVALYRPDFTLTGTEDKTQFQARETRFWVGADRDPASSAADAEGWRGVSAKIGEHTSVTRLPFVTSFSTGRGLSYARDGRVSRRGPWNDLSAQDVLPTWRWLVRGGSLTADYDFASAWNGGSSLRLTGELPSTADVSLFAARARIVPGTRLSVVASGSVRLSADLRFADRPDADVVVPLGKARSGWTSLSASLSKYTGRTLTSVGLRLSDASSPSVDVHLGELALRTPSARPEPPSHVRVVPSTDGGARVTWKASPTKNVRYNVFVDGRWAGATSYPAKYVGPDLGAEADNVAIEAVNLNGDRSRRASSQ